VTVPNYSNMLKRGILIGAVILALVISVYLLLRPPKSGPLPQPVVDETTSALATVPQPALEPAEGSLIPVEPASVFGGVYGEEWPAPGVVVVALSTETQAVELQAVTDKDGQYMLAGLMPEVMYKIVVETQEDGLVATSIPQVELSPGEALHVNIRLRNVREELRKQLKGSISGRVMEKRISYRRANLVSRLIGYKSERNELLAGVEVLLTGRIDRGTIYREAVSDRHGRYTFQGLTTGSYTVEAEPPAGALSVERRPRTLGLQPGEHKDDVDFEFRLDGVVLAGHVTDVRGHPIEGATVVANPVEMTESYGVVRKTVSAVTDMDGRYQIEGITPPNIKDVYHYVTKGTKPKMATYAVRACAYGYAAVGVVVPTITDNLVREARSLGYLGSSSSAEGALPKSDGNIIILDFVLKEDTVVSGRLVDTLGKIVPNARLRMVFADSHSGEPESLVAAEVGSHSVKTDEEGWFVFEGVPSGVYLFEIETKVFEWQRSHNAPLEVSRGKPIENLDVIVEAAELRGSIAGLVLDATSEQPIQKFHVVVTNVDSPGENSPRHGHKTIDKPQAGAFLIEDISPGTASLRITAKGYGEHECQVEVVSGETRSVTLYLTAAGVLHGYVTLNGDPVETAKISPWSVERQRKAQRGGNVQGAQTNEEGYYEIRDLHEGTYIVKVRYGIGSPDGPCPVMGYDRVPVEIESGQTTQLDFDFRGSAMTRGSFTHHVTNLSWWCVAVSTADGASHDDLDDDEQRVAWAWNIEKSGYYEIGNLPRGTYTVTGICRERTDPGFVTLAEQSRTVSLGEGATVEVDFDFR